MLRSNWVPIYFSRLLSHSHVVFVFFCDVNAKMDFIPTLLPSRISQQLTNENYHFVYSALRARANIKKFIKSNQFSI